MKPHIKYLWYVLRHKWFVFIECLKLGVPIWAAIIHDWQKFTPVEWRPYVLNFFGPWKKDNKPEWLKTAFGRAWLHHIHYGPHHWEYWLQRTENTRWTIQQYSMENPCVLALDNHPLLFVELDGKDDDIHSGAYRILQDVVKRLNNCYEPIEMPDRYRREMLADWRGAGRAINGKDDTLDFYMGRRDNIKLHPKTREWIEHQLGVAFLPSKKEAEHNGARD